MGGEQGRHRHLLHPGNRYHDSLLRRRRLATALTLTATALARCRALLLLLLLLLLLGRRLRILTLLPGAPTCRPLPASAAAGAALGRGRIVVILLGAGESAPMLLKHPGLLLAVELTGALGVVQRSACGVRLISLESERPTTSALVGSGDEEGIHMAFEVRVEVLERVPHPIELLNLGGLQRFLDESNEVFPAHKKGQRVTELHGVRLGELADVRLQDLVGNAEV